jgi:lyso-ornithine lipid O-acyltransferase
LRYLTMVRLAVRLNLFVFGLAVLTPFIRIFMPFKPLWAHRLCMWVHSYSCWAFNVKVTSIGEPVGDRSDEPVLYVMNHISWMDIVVIGGLIKQACFVAKAELENWPVFGAAGDNIILFPEGTSGLGGSVLPFKTSLFGLSDDPRLANLIIQPVTLSYTHLNGLPLLRSQRSLIAWVGDMSFGAHALPLLSQSSLKALVQFHAPVRCGAYANRKLLSAACEDVISRGLRRANRGRTETAVATALPDRL